MLGSKSVVNLSNFENSLFILLLLLVFSSQPLISHGPLKVFSGILWDISRRRRFNNLKCNQNKVPEDMLLKQYSFTTFWEWFKQYYDCKIRCRLEFCSFCIVRLHMINLRDCKTSSEKVC